MIEATWSKRRILELYLNVIEWGNGVFGAEAAARRYYKNIRRQPRPRPGRPHGRDGAQPALVRKPPQLTYLSTSCRRYQTLYGICAGTALSRVIFMR